MLIQGYARFLHRLGEGFGALSGVRVTLVGTPDHDVAMALTDEQLHGFADGLFVIGNDPTHSFGNVDAVADQCRNFILNQQSQNLRLFVGDNENEALAAFIEELYFALCEWLTLLGVEHHQVVTYCKGCLNDSTQSLRADGSLKKEFAVFQNANGVRFDAAILDGDVDGDIVEAPRRLQNLFLMTRTALAA